MSASNRINVQIFPDLAGISRKASEIFLNLSEHYISLADRFTIALSGGRTPFRLYSLLGSDYFLNILNWNRIHFFWADERCVPANDHKSNFRLAFETFLSRSPVPEKNIHRIKGEEEPEKAASDYATEIRDFFGGPHLPVFDCVILGMGEDGHIASIFPDSELLADTLRLAAPVHMIKPETDRISLTLPVLNNAAHLLLLVSGKSKARVLKSVFEKRIRKVNPPAGFLKPLHGDITWLIDKEAAQGLSDEWSEFHYNRLRISLQDKLKQ